MKNTIRALRYFRPDGPRIVFVAGLLILSIALNALKPWPLAWIVDSVLLGKPLPAWLDGLSHRSKPALLALFSSAILVLYLLQGALSAAQNYLSIQVGLRGLTRVRNEVFAWLQRLSLRFHQGARAGDLIYRASWDAYAFQTLFQQGLMTFVAAALSLLIMVAIMARINGPLTLAALALVPLLIAAIKFFGGKMRQQTAAAQQADSRVTSLVQQAIATLPLTQSYTREEAEAARFNAQTARAEKERLRQHGRELVYWLAISVVFGIGTAAITWLGAAQVSAGALTVGELLVFLAYVAQLYEPLNQLSHVGATVSGASASTRRIFEILDTPEEVKDAPEAKPLPASRGELVFDRVFFGYRSDCDALQEVSFSIKARETIAIIGPSGAGKTTLLHLLARFFDPRAGSIRLDGTDLRQLRLKDLRTQIAFVFQEPIILPATIAENIAYGKADATLDQIKAATRAANADAFVEKLPDKYDTLIGEGATRFSAGERQRISLARAFLKDAPILLLDEPTSALDTENEAAVEAGLQQLIRGRTTIMVAHRLSTIARMQRILVLEEGRVAEYGAPADLKKAGGYYARVIGGQTHLG